MRQRSRGDKGNGALLSSVFPEIKNETTMNKLPSWLVMMETFFFSLRGDKQIMSPLYLIFKESAGTWGGGGRECRPGNTTATGGRKDSDCTENRS